jgi:hypothetical protein
MSRLVTFAILGLLSGTALAKPVTLSCVQADGAPAADLVVDVERGTMEWSLYRYRITSVTDRFITGVDARQGAVGGEVWVQDRVSGRYMRGGVAVEASGVDANGNFLNMRVVPSTAQGTCKAPML